MGTNVAEVDMLPALAERVRRLSKMKPFLGCDHYFVYDVNKRLAECRCGLTFTDAELDEP